MRADAIERLDDVRQEIARATARSGQGREPILIAVSKTYSSEQIEPFLIAGQRHYGENRVQEAAAKWPGLRVRYPDTILHLIGQLQSNKAADAVALFEVIHSVDRPSLIKGLGQAMADQAKWPECFIQVNIGEEAQKGGCAIDAVPNLLNLARGAAVPIAGLMCIPPADVEPAPYFALLVKLARKHGLTGLSMGMSSDYTTATMVGATHLRVGSALFGARN